MMVRTEASGEFQRGRVLVSGAGEGSNFHGILRIRLQRPVAVIINGCFTVRVFTEYEDDAFIQFVAFGAQIIQKHKRQYKVLCCRCLFTLKHRISYAWFDDLYNKYTVLSANHQPTPSIANIFKVTYITFRDGYIRSGKIMRSATPLHFSLRDNTHQLPTEIRQNKKGGQIDNFYISPTLHSNTLCLQVDTRQV